MKVKMITRMAGPNGQCEPGEEIDLDKDFAKALVEGGYAEPVKDLKASETDGDKNEHKGNNATSGRATKSGGGKAKSED